MNQLDVYYRAWLNYRAITAKNRDCALFRRNVAHTDTELESLSIIRNICNVDGARDTDFCLWFSVCTGAEFVCIRSFGKALGLYPKAFFVFETNCF